MRNEKLLYIVIPCYNEEEVLPTTASALKALTSSLISKEIISRESRVLFVDDGSKDRTWQIISDLHASDPLFSGLKLAHNKGHQNALIAGMFYASDMSDVIISMDADLQDDINAVSRMLEKYHSGCEIVYGVRSGRKKDSLFKRTTAQGFYKFMKSLGVDVVYNHADYRLMSKKAVSALKKYKEVNLFLRGIVPLIGFKSDTVEYERGERAAGVSKYPLKKMLAFALDGITSFSVKPLRIISVCGFLIFAMALVALIYTVCVKLFGYTVDGWSSLVASMWLLGGLTLLSLGVVGEYIGKIYFEVKERPRFETETILDTRAEISEAGRETINLLLKRRSIRSYEKKPVPRPVLEALLECAKHAPTALGIQPWHFTVIESREVLNLISKANRMMLSASDDPATRKSADNPQFDNFRGAPCAIIVSGLDESTYADYDCANACENIIIAAEACGLSTCYLASFKAALNRENGGKLISLLGIPEGFSPRLAVAIGYGNEKPAERKPRRENSVNYI